MTTLLRSSWVALFTLWAVAGAHGQLKTSPGDPLPAWLKARIAELEKRPELFGAGEIRKLQYRNEDAYLFLPSRSIADGFHDLYDSSGTFICSPSGGITGRGHGKCPDAMPPETRQLVIWRQQGRE